MPDPTTVWLVRAGAVEGVPGRLTFDDAALVFTPHGEGKADVRMPGATLRTARRVRGSPVLLLEVAEPDGERTLLLYFTKPPPIPTPGGPDGRSMINPMRGLERAAAGMSLRAAGKERRKLIDAWVDEIRRLSGA